METNLKGLNLIGIDMFCIVFQFRSQKCNSSRARPSESSDDRLDLSLRFMLSSIVVLLSRGKKQCIAAIFKLEVGSSTLDKPCNAIWSVDPAPPKHACRR